MAAFSYQHYPSLLDTIFLPNTPTKNMSVFSEEGDTNTNTSCFPQFHPLSEAPLDLMFHQGGLHVNQSSKVASSDNETSVTKKQSTDSSTVVDKLESGEQVTQKLTPADRKRKIKDGSSLNSAQSKLEARAVKNKRQRKSNMAEMDEEKKPKSDKKASEEPPTGYIHVRARRGQATDSHSLAERVRREKISERMKILQRLVPGCDKVTGKALMLDEIINYVQSLQNQVEFLSMKLASFNPLFYDFGPDLDAFMVRPERLSGLSSPLPSLQQCSTFQPTAFADASATATATTTATATNTTFATDQNTYPPIDNPALLLLNQDSESLLWEVEAQRQKFHNLSGFNTNLCSFH